MLGFTGATLFAERTISQLITVFVIFVAVSVIFWFFYVKRTGVNDSFSITGLRFSILLIVSVAIVFVLSPLCDKYVLSVIGRVLCLVLMMIVDLMVLFAAFGVFEESALETENK